MQINPAEFKLLVVDDVQTNVLLLKALLGKEGYGILVANNGQEALEVIRNENPDLILLDVMMPGMDGFRLAERVRSKDKNLPILFMTALEDKPSQERGYRLGIDDYVVKPFDADLFLLRVAALLRRAKIEADAELVAGNLTMNREEHTAYLNGEELPLTVREFDLLFKLLSYPKKTFTRSRLMTEFWDFDSSATSRTVDVYMAKLREKTAACDGFEIVTVHGLGYKAVLK